MVEGLIVGVDHIGIAVQNLEEALEIFEKKLGLKLEGVHEIKEQRVKAAMLLAGETRIELLEPIGQEGPVARFLEKRGEGFHHIAFKVKNIEGLLAQLKERGIILVDEKPRVGVKGAKIAFLHPKSTKNVLVELCEE